VSSFTNGKKPGARMRVPLSAIAFQGLPLTAPILAGTHPPLAPKKKAPKVTFQGPPTQTHTGKTNLGGRLRGSRVGWGG
jgi:hypothetical protein